MRNLGHVALIQAFTLSFAACAVGNALDGDGADLQSGTVDEDAGGGTTWPDGGAPSDPGADGGTTGDGGKSNPPSDGGQDANPPGPTACQQALSALTFDFESNATGWVHGVLDGAENDAPSWPLDEWAWGTATQGMSCKGGSKCVSTHLSKNYAQCARGYLESPTVDLSTCSADAVTLVVNHAYEFWTGNYDSSTWYDGGIIEISGDGGSTWTSPAMATSGTLKINPRRTSTYKCVRENSFSVHNKAGFVGSSGGWTKLDIAVPATLRTSQFKIRFSYGSGVSSSTGNAENSRSATGFGWTIDDIGFENR